MQIYPILTNNTINTMKALRNTALLGLGALSITSPLKAEDPASPDLSKDPIIDGLPASLQP
ncbi:hypothetical protein [Rubritalea tangerina]